MPAYPAAQPIDLIKSEIAATAAIADQITLSFVINELKDHAALFDYRRHSITNEYMADADVSEIVTALRENGIDVLVHQGERAFLSTALSDAWIVRPRPKHYVFNTTGSGTGRARTSLIPSFCHLAGIGLCSADGYTAAILENKFHCFRLLQGFGFPTPQTWLYDAEQGWIGGNPPAGLKVICKPNLECSSIGIDDRAVFHFGDGHAMVVDALSREFRQPILVQEFIPGREVEVPVFPCSSAACLLAVGIDIEGQQDLADRFLTYDIVGNHSYGFYDFSDHNPSIAQHLMQTAEHAYRSMSLTGLVRIDYRVSPVGRACITDVNTPPHLTQHSSCHFSFSRFGLSHSDLMLMVASVGRIAEGRHTPDQI